MLVDALFKTSYANPSLNFDINVCNVFEKSALRIAIENEDVDMCKILLKHKVTTKRTHEHYEGSITEAKHQAFIKLKYFTD